MMVMRGATTTSGTQQRKNDNNWKVDTTDKKLIVTDIKEIKITSIPVKQPGDFG